MWGSDGYVPYNDAIINRILMKVKDDNNIDFWVNHIINSNIEDQTINYLESKLNEIQEEEEMQLVRLLLNKLIETETTQHPEKKMTRFQQLKKKLKKK
jgi:hypothetical protein